MRKHSRVILLAEEQLVFGRSLPEMVVARDNLRGVVPVSLLLELLDARIARKRVGLHSPVSPWAACAPATIGHATAEPSDATNSRRLMSTSRASGPALAGSRARLPASG
jgi:hypothetical protein